MASPHPVLVVGVIALALAANVASTVFVRRMRKGRFDVMARTASGTSFRTDLATFRIDTAHRTVARTGKDGRGSAPLADVRAVRIREAEQSAWLLEWMRGLDITDLMGRYRDSMLWWTVSLTFDDGSEWPLFIAGQYQPREFLLGGYLAWQYRVLVRLGWITDVPDHVQGVAEAIQQLLERGGVRVPVA